MGMNLIKEMKNKIAQSGSSKKEIVYWGKDSVKRIRFLQELDAGYEFDFHNDWDTHIFVLCKDPEDHESCKYCSEGISIQENFVWSIWDYDSNSIKLMQFKANGISPIPSFIEMYEEFGTIMDRDYKVKKVGQGQGSSYVVTPLDKERFNNKKAKPYTREQVEKIFKKAYQPAKLDEVDEEEEEVEVEVKKPAKKAKEKESLRDKFEELSKFELKEIALEVGLSKKELKGMDEEEIIEELFDNYEEDDLKEIYENIDSDEDEDED